MIIVKLIGGLGNQFFQYAVGRHIAEINDMVLKLDISGFETSNLRKYSLWAFNIQETFACQEEIAALKFQKDGILTSIVRRALGRPSREAATYIQGKNLFQFDPGILNQPCGAYLEGSWQNEKYFKDIEDIIRGELTVKTPQTGKNKELAEQISSCNSVSLHVRRADYVTNPVANKILGTCEPAYYASAVEKLIQRVSAPHFFVFSDDHEWVHEKLKLPYPTTIVDHNGDNKNYEDLRLMSQCKHHIIANSTFSWWSAWLSKNPSKIIFAPKRWLKTDLHDASNLIPPSWVKV